MRTRTAAICIAVASLLVLALGVGSASASTLSVPLGPELTAAPGEVNHVRVTFDGSSYVIRDSAPITLGNAGDCALLDPNSARCPAAAAYGGGVEAPRVRLGDGDDSFTWEGPALPQSDEFTPTLTVEAGPGNDTVDGSPGTDYLAGDEGADRITGGDGDDTIHEGVDADPDIADSGAGIDAIYAYSGDTATGGPGNDAFYAHEGSNVRARDGGRDNFECRGLLASIQADIRTVEGFPDGQDLPGGCVANERARIKLDTKTRRFKITKRTRAIKLTFSCPRTAVVLCETNDVGADLGWGSPCLCFSSKPFRIVPGGRITVTARIRADDGKELYEYVRARRKLKGFLSWNSELLPNRDEGVRITLVR